jgi:hypothetical protein
MDYVSALLSRQGAAALPAIKGQPVRELDIDIDTTQTCQQRGMTAITALIAVRTMQ